MNRAMRAAAIVVTAGLGLGLLGQTPSNLELAGKLAALEQQNAALRQQNAALQEEVAKLRAENAELLKRAGGAAATRGAATRPEVKGATTKAAGGKEQDGPGLYRVTAGRYRRFGADIRATSRQDALNQGMKTVVKKAMDFDENSETGEIVVEKLGN